MHTPAEHVPDREMLDQLRRMAAEYREVVAQSKRTLRAAMQLLAVANTMSSPLIGPIALLSTRRRMEVGVSAHHPPANGASPGRRSFS